MSADSNPPNRVSLGILLMTGFAIIAPCMDALAKLLGESIGVGQIVAFRFGVQTAILLPVSFWFGWLHRPDMKEMSLHVLRGVLIMVATAFFFQAVRYMPIADAIAIFFVEPFFLTLLGAWFLGEAIGMRRYMACAIGFCGALLVIQPSFAKVGAPALLPLGTAVCFAFYLILTRKMSQRMHPVTLQVYSGAAAVAIILPVLWVFDGSAVAPLDPAWPLSWELWMLLGIGFIATLSHLCISFAFAYAPVSILAPIQYLEIVAATILGYFIFNDLPDVLTVLGVLLIVGAGLFVFFRERQADKQPLPEPTNAAQSR